MARPGTFRLVLVTIILVTIGEKGCWAFYDLESCKHTLIKILRDECNVVHFMISKREAHLDDSGGRKFIEFTEQDERELAEELEIENALRSEPPVTGKRASLRFKRSTKKSQEDKEKQRHRAKCCVDINTCKKNTSLLKKVCKG